ncbi:DUF6447 family protein [Vreelandella sp. EE7]
MQETQTVTLDGVEYSLDQLNNAAKLQLSHLRQADQEITRLKQQLAIAQTARSAYAQSLMGDLPE